MTILQIVAVVVLVLWAIGLGWLWLEARRARRRELAALTNGARLEATARALYDKNRQHVARRLAARAR